MSEWKSHNKTDYGESWDFEKNKVCQGIYINRRSNVGKNHQEVYEIDVAGTNFTVWGSKTLNDAMQDVNLGEIVRIEFTGMGDSPKAIKPFKKFDVKSKENEEEVEEIKLDDKEDEMPF